MVLFIRFLTIAFLIFFILVVNTINAQPQKPKVYIDTGTSKRYNQHQFDSLTRLTNTDDSDKTIIVIDKLESRREVKINFATMTVKSDASVKRGWLGKKLPPFSLKDIKGNIHNNATIAGKVVVLNLWSITCHPCIDEIPLLNLVVRKYLPNQDVLFLAPAPETLAQITNVLSRYAFAYTVIPQAQTIFDLLDASGYPYHIVINKDGYIRYIQGGTINTKTGEKIAESELSNAIEQVLKQ